MNNRDDSGDHLMDALRYGSSSLEDIYENQISLFDSSNLPNFVNHPVPRIQCECGVSSIGVGLHSSWCPVSGSNE